MDEQKDGWIHGWINKWIFFRMDLWTDRDKWMNPCSDRLMDGWWMD